MRRRHRASDAARLSAPHRSPRLAPLHRGAHRARRADGGRVERLRAAELEVARERVVARWDRSLYWPREEMLVVADLHVGKTQSLRARGMTLPDGVLDDD